MSSIFFFDTEFVEAGSSRPLQLISIAIVSLDGRELYAISSDFDPSQCSPWLMDNVVALLPPPETLQRLTNIEIAKRIRQFVGSNAPIFWTDCGCYDHVLLAQHGRVSARLAVLHQGL
jgi:3' exoribonuclease, RNase T-like